MNKKAAYILITLVLISFSSLAQRWRLTRTELTFGIGTANYFGDIGGALERDKIGIMDLEFGSTRPNFNAGIRYRLTERINIRGNFAYALLSASDKNSVNEARNYSFSTHLLELYGHVEYSITEEKPLSHHSTMAIRSGLKRFGSRINVFAFAGLGGSFFRPIAKDALVDSDRFVNNKNLALVIPLGLGVKYPYTNQLFIGFELGGRFTTSDYIDGFTSDYSEANDIYYFTQISVAYKLEPKRTRSSRIRF